MIVPEYLYVKMEEIASNLTDYLIIDVRSPCEYNHGHIEGAFNLPLFSDEERALVGTSYKKEGKGYAIDLGLKIVGPKLYDYVATLRALKESTGKNEILLHCARGGMRSQSLAWLFQLSGIKVHLLWGGYKEFRRFARNSYANCSLIILGGETGSGKTKILRELIQMGEQVVDLEAIANHKGSAFGSVNELPQPTNEQFENRLFDSFRRLDLAKVIWVENESRAIGRVSIPDTFFMQMRKSPLINIKVSKESRVKNILEDYKTSDLELLIYCTQKITKKLGGDRTKEVVGYLRGGNLESAIAIILDYYDSLYGFTLTKRAEVQIFELDLTQSTALPLDLKNYYYQKIRG